MVYLCSPHEISSYMYMRYQGAVDPLYCIFTLDEDLWGHWDANHSHTSSVRIEL